MSQNTGPLVSQHVLTKPKTELKPNVWIIHIIDIHIIDKTDEQSVH